MSKNIDLIWSFKLPRSLKGKTVVVIDILAATTNMAGFLNSGVGDFLLATEENIFKIREKYPKAYIIGESKNPQIEKLLYASNSPSLLQEKGVFGTVKDRDIIYLTNNGTRVINMVMEKEPQDVITASFANFQRVIDWLKKQRTNGILLVAAGEINFADGRADEDYICAQAISDLLRGKKIKWPDLNTEITKSIRTKYPPLYKDAGLSIRTREKDIAIVIRRNTHPVVPKCVEDGEGIVKVNCLPN